MNVLVFSTIFPSRVDPIRGLYNLRTFEPLAEICNVRVVCPTSVWKRVLRPRELLFTPAVPGFVPSERAYAPSLRAYQLVRAAIGNAVARRHLHPAALTDNGTAMFIALVAGVAAQQTANDAGTGFDEGRYTALLDPALDMYASYFSPDRPAHWTPWR